MLQAHDHTPMIGCQEQNQFSGAHFFGLAHVQALPPQNGAEPSGHEGTMPSQILSAAAPPANAVRPITTAKTNVQIELTRINIPHC
ncbi:hypothetical protein CI1B_60610 [Bradyrhizobium ivorense]|uniref:Uncharacterized protein n=1 Tax=Bradyrhizobium ivorense TaxID=2511166 RepID=A0A508TN81_9BRAD|nr:hypothetical protein CI1B_60610 [Bradyrhizobium ivorense]